MFITDPYSNAAESAAARLMYERATVIAALHATALLTGPSGSGKSMLARRMHESGPRQSKPFVTVCCGAIPREILESELFGHEPSALTGAFSSKPGRIEEAHGGTLFLDEIGDLPLELQPKLLAFLQERTARRIGGTGAQPLNVRIIAATHQDLRGLIAERKFREDLFYRVHVLPLPVPPLAARSEDIQPLADEILAWIGSPGRSDTRYVLTPGARRALSAHTWPGNIRELENVLQRAAAFCKRGQIEADDLDITLPRAQTQKNGVAAGQETDKETPPPPTLAGLTMQQIERRALIDTLSATGGNKAAAARSLGISEKSVYNKLRRHSIEAAQWGTSPSTASANDPSALPAPAHATA